MGLKKIYIETLPTEYERKVKFAKRIKGLKKKSEELTTLCDAPHLLVAFSPTKKPIVSIGKSTFEEMVSAYSNTSEQLRQEGKDECLKKLEKSCRKANIPIDVSQLKNHSVVESNLLYEKKKAQLKKVKEQICYVQNVMGPLSYLGDLDQIDSMDMLTKMENSLLHLLQQNRLRSSLFSQQGQASGVNVQQHQ